MYVTEGRTLNDIAKYYDVSSTHVRQELIRMGLIVTPDTPTTTKADCIKCIYGGGTSVEGAGKVICNYILATGAIRGCTMEHCNRYTKGKKVNISREHKPQHKKVE
jgi:hypothetical protein